ncbi:hypothetical protein JTE90_029222 [Oedothorax gibbosus]|uniref:Uncharacterized protein n=1 Tax=Oedothorax gibbosus TaxID=931172 RepID=A0AAV6VFC4_9ARAC|nr:hypothetical protein JTE90_029222 [Oedothorax gibbosus]
MIRRTLFLLETALRKCKDGFWNSAEEMQRRVLQQRRGNAKTGSATAQRKCKDGFWKSACASSKPKLYTNLRNLAQLFLFGGLVSLDLKLKRR